MTKRIGIWMMALSLLALPVQAGDDANARMMVHLLDYLAVDYSMAVDQGQIISEAEYAEMQEFSLTIREMTAASGGDLQSDAALLQELVDKKAPRTKIASVANSLKQKIINHYDLEVGPKRWPEIQNGAEIYKLHCQACHGPQGKGKGAMAEGLEPAPTNFHAADKAQGLSPFQAYNTIRLGVEGTSMRAFDELSDDEVWDLAFYVISMQYREEVPFTAAEAPRPEMPLTLAQLASLDNNELQEKLNVEANAPLLAALRLYPTEVGRRPGDAYIAKAIGLIKQSVSQYENDAAGPARTSALTAYLEGVEPIEMQLRAHNAPLVAQIESTMGGMRSAIEKGAATELVQERATQSIELLQEAQQSMEADSFGTGLAFMLSSSIILREGLEAFLVIITILGIIRAMKLPRAARWVHLGWLAALASGVGLWFAAGQLFTFTGAQRELMEGFIAIFAVGVLLYVGFWMHSKSQAGRWQAYVKEKIQTLARRENMLGLALLSFLVVFREAFESVLFLSALNLEVAAGDQWAFTAGIVAAFIALFVISVLLLRYSKKIPIPKLFKYSAMVISFLAVILAGKGIHALQEAGSVSISVLPAHFSIDALGVYATWETLLAQAAILLLVFILWNVSQRKGLPAKTERSAAPSQA
ncbi:MAG: FTR1 family protein [Schleiferiaceae bacterium]|nr:FTR1 family protein [Schleiferiaceae bacterium]